MSLGARRRIEAIDILQNDFEYCTISYYAKGINNELGEPKGILIQRDSNVKCSIDILPSSSSLINKKGYGMSTQGYTENIIYHMVLNAEQVIEKGDIVTDVNGTKYEVLSVCNWYTHKEVFLRKIN